MKLLIVQDYLRVGGTERQTLFLANHFTESGDSVSLLTFRPGGHLATPENLRNIKLDTLQPFDSKLPLWAPGLMRAVDRSQAEIILCMGRTANCYAGFIQKRFPQKVVVGTLRTGKVLFPLHHWSMGVVRAVLVNSNWWKRRLLERGFPEERIHVIHNAVLLERREAERLALRKEMRERFNLTDDTVLYLNVATFRPGKRHIDLLRIMKRIRTEEPGLDWRLWLVGDGKEFHRCKEWAATNGLGTRIRFFHFQTDPFPFYAAADIAVSTSREDSLPNFLIEAQASKLPIVAYDCRGVVETCIPNKTGFVCPSTEEDVFIQSLLRLSNDKKLRTSFANRTDAFVADRFSPEPQAKAVRSFLQTLLQSSRNV